MGTPRLVAAGLGIALAGALTLATAPGPAGAQPPGSSDEIVLGVLADYTGPFAELSPEIVDGQLAYYTMVNEQGGVHGRRIRLEVRDTGYDVATHVQRYEELRDEVTAFSLSLGSPQTAAIVADLVADEMLAIPLSWTSAWAQIPNVLALQASYCTEAINAVGTLMHPGDTMAVIGFPGEYGDDAAAGARYAADELGVDIVSETRLTSEQAFIDAITDLVTLQPDWVYVAASPAALFVLVDVAGQSGYAGQWTGAAPTWNPILLTTPIAPVLEDRYVISTYTAAWGDDVRGMDELVDAASATFPGRAPSDPFVVGWTQAEAMTQLLRRSGPHATSADVVAAAQRGNLQFGELAPKQKLNRGDRSEVRATAFYRPSLAAFAASQGATTSYDELLVSELLHPLGVSDLAADADVSAACLDPGP